ncbi:hypothetical protein [Mucilaginibacter polytrichastri]|uniref:Uncharacterized protein n=1 Tax=Mucilaginibacter polytrichastri TaxID=1302689 RepID=A0A1Q5ZS48_9SPHI|nr:hypothetical protein [Mucilaginibacter polytrichastri]OKS84601.1 hypothetical protein RG47T_0033 [Mucilaginibacter polytrichastri]SFT02461.1 hypothetical protein SAMN04487890_108202 [Mucilaginibacter polytrichastri]
MKITSNFKRAVMAGLVFIALNSFINVKSIIKERKTPEPRIVNIVNFIRLLEPRDPAITQDVLYQTVVKQVELMKKHHLGGTFLLQYDALMDSRYQQLLKTLPKESFEIGAWWELPQPLIEKAGLKWRGRYPWDWHADVGFATGYTPSEREKIIDVYMADFKKIFGYYPRSVASWFIDAHSLQYMYDKYKIVASANCKDQYGTDGYTLWGGYWNQAYYPSRINSYMPAQNAANQIPVPVFRMLGSDPVRQYDTGINSARQGVITLEPVYPKAGGNADWIDWFFDAFTRAPALGFNYTQAGQENSFTWPAMQKGLEIQFPLIEKLRNEGKVRVETMEQSGLWFRKIYPVTPPTSFTVTKDVKGSNQKTIWYNSRFYRINIMWEDSTLRIRDIHFFNENIADKYTTQTATSNECQFFTLPVVDGYLWSKRGDLAGLKLKAVSGGKESLLKGGDPVFTNVDKETVDINWPLAGGGMLKLRLKEKTAAIELVSSKPLNWFFDLEVAQGAKTPFVKADKGQVSYRFEGHDYQLKLIKGAVSAPATGAVFRLQPQSNVIDLNMTDMN